MSESAGIPTSAHSMSSSSSTTASAQLSPVTFSMNMQEDDMRAVSDMAGLPGHVDPLVATATLPGRLDAGISVSASVHPVRSTHPTETAVSSVPEISSSRSEWDSSARTRGLFDYPLVTPVSHSAGTTQELGMTNLSVTAAPYFSTGVRSIGTLPPHSGVHTAGLAEHRVSWSMSGERPLQFTANPRLIETAAAPRLLQPVATPRPLPPLATQLSHANPPLPALANLQPATPYLLGQQLPPMSKFSGEDMEGDGETFLEWIEQFELVAGICSWNDQAKLVNLTTRLRGQAYSFYRTFNPQQRSDYQQLKSKLAERFTPVRIQAVHSNLFHQRKQDLGEAVDHYAQDLRRLFYKAYPKATDITNTLRTRLEDPQLKVRNFGGEEVNIVGQATVTLSCGNHKSQITLLVQKGTELELLLGTDILGKLGFQVLQCDKDGKTCDLLSAAQPRKEESKAEVKQAPPA